MEGAILGGKLAAEVIVDRANGREGAGVKAIQQHIVETAHAAEPREPIGVRGNYPIAFGGGQQGVGASVSHP